MKAVSASTKAPLGDILFNKCYAACEVKMSTETLFKLEAIFKVELSYINRLGEEENSTIILEKNFIPLVLNPLHEGVDSPIANFYIDIPENKGFLTNNLNSFSRSLSHILAANQISQDRIKTLGIEIQAKAFFINEYLEKSSVDIYTKDYLRIA